MYVFPFYSLNAVETIYKSGDFTFTPQIHHSWYPPDYLSGLWNRHLWISCAVDCNFYFACGAVAKYYDEHVCVSVCLSARISPESQARSLPIFVQVAYGRSSVLFRHRCVRYALPILWTTCFSYTGPYRGIILAEGPISNGVGLHTAGEV